MHENSLNIFFDIISIMDPKPTLWKQEADQFQTPTLRQPRTFPKDNYSSSTQQITQANSIELNDISAALNETVKPNNLELVAKSNLRASAPEWYPTQNVYVNDVESVNSFTPVESSNRSVQNRLKVHKVQANTVSIPNEMTDTSENDFNRLRQIINTLTKDPGQYHNLLDLFIETLQPHLDDLEGSSLIAQIIVEQALNHPSFRYTGARMCFLIEEQSPHFRAELYIKCKKQVDDNPDVKNVLLLVAELYIHLPNLFLYGALLISAFHKLINQGGNENIKCVCQALKLTGYSLEKSNKSELDNVIAQLKSVKDRVTGTASFLLESIFQLRASNWGHSVDEFVDTVQESELTFDEIDNKVFYDIDGEGLTTEESEFIATHMPAHADYDSEDSDDPDELCDPEPEMDEEIQQAFREFVRLSDKH